MNTIIVAPGKRKTMFDHEIKTPFKNLNGECFTIQDIIFSKLPHRREECTVLRSHIGDEYIEITLHQLRYIISILSKKISEKDLSPGNTVMLLSLPGCNELFTALYFATLTSMGIRVFMPMFPEIKELEEWIDKTNTKAVIAPLSEINRLNDFEREKITALNIKSLSETKKINFYDSLDSFDILSVIQQSKLQLCEKYSFPLYSFVDPESEAVIVTTSGTSGKTKLVVYEQKAFALNCLSWQQAGLFREEFFCNAGFTPLFTHTIGIRSFMNAIWTGNPVCFIITDWFYKYPEQVCYFLLKMKPAHIIGGPAMFNALMELYRYFPELKQSLSKSLKAFISIGAPFAEGTAQLLRSATGITLYNAYGTTETQMASIALDGGTDLGSPLPGVVFGLKNLNDGSHLYQLHVHTPFQSARIIGEQKRKFYYTGDLVSLADDNKIVLVSRENADFIKDDFGVKIPLTFLKKYYRELFAATAHIEWYPLKSKPGLAALCFIKNSAADISLKKIAGLLKNINHELKKEIEPFEYNHRHIAKIALLHEDIPLTRKGTVSKSLINDLHRQLIDDLVNPISNNERIKITDKDDENSIFQQYVNPDLGEMLKALKMDVTFSSAIGDHLFYQKNNKEIKILDMVGGYGSNFLGHNHPAVKKAVIDFISENKVAIHNQGSIQNGVAALAEKLNLLLSNKTKKNFKAQFGNSGAEAVEIAMHHAYLEWRKNIEKLRDDQLQLFGAIEEMNVREIWNKNMRTIEEATPHVIGINNCFHGYTGSARSLLNIKKRRSLFSGLLKVKPLLIDDDNEKWEEIITQLFEKTFVTINKIVRKNGVYVLEEFNCSTIIASIIEPVMGEGGIKTINENLADHLAGLDIPLISDEIQCGLGRTGTIPAYNKASYYLFGKALGGGFEKISAVLIDSNRFQSSFPKYYASTFANGDLAACIAAKTIDIIVKEKLEEQSLEKGDYYKTSLIKLAAKYPQVISGIKGKGLMIGIYLNKELGKDNVIFRMMFQQELAGYLFSAWLFNKHQIRIFPSLAAANCLRVEPSCYISEMQIDKFCSALEELCKLCKEKKIYKLLSFLMNDDIYDDRNETILDGKFPLCFEEPLPGAKKVGFISHFTFPLAELKLIEPELHNASDTGLRILFNKMQLLMEGKPFKILSKNLMNGKVHFSFYIIPVDSAQLENAHKWGKKRTFISKMQDAVDMLAMENVSHISLGGYASILTNNGLMLAHPAQTKIITGNTLTAASCLHYLYKYVNDHTDKQLKIAIVGVTGNIGNGLAECIAENRSINCSLLLVGHNVKRLQQIEKKLSILTNEAILETSCDLFSLQEADVIICCTNTSDPIIFPHHISKTKNVFIIDMSVPVAISNQVKKLGNVTVCKAASHIVLPDDKELLISSHTPKGSIFCCAAEVLLDALYNSEYSLKGRLEPKAINALYQMAKQQKLLS